MFGLLVQRICSLAEPEGERWAKLIEATNIMVSVIPPVLAVAYVVRRDGRGLGGLVVHQKAEGPELSRGHAELDAPSIEVLDAAQLRLKAMASW
jgi:hypothetical protein